MQAIRNTDEGGLEKNISKLGQFLNYSFAKFIGITWLILIFKNFK